MNIAVCDDEKEIREQIRDLIVKNNSGITVETYESGDELLAINIQFDVVFLDIQMEGRNGIEIARILRERGKDAVLIFLTGLKEYVFEAFDVMAFHYLLKPVKEDKFVEVFYRAVKEAEKRKGAAGENKLFLKMRKHHFTIAANDILYVENRGFIRLLSFQKGRMFFLEIENSFDGRLLRKKDFEFPVTDKSDKKAHGIGLINMKNTAEKYHGDVDWSVESFSKGSQKFTVTIMMQNERRDDNGFGIDR